MFVCGTCQKTYNIAKTGALCIDYDKDGPLRVTACDAYECPGCATILLAGFASTPMISRGDPDFDQFVNPLWKDLDRGVCSSTAFRRYIKS